MQSQRSQNQNQRSQQINWNQYNYPPLLSLMHFRPSQIPSQKKRIVMMAFIIHLTIFLNTFLNIIDNIILGGLGILYAFLFFFIFNPIVLFLFYRCYLGLCKEKSKLSLFVYIQPLAIIVELIVAIVDALGFNGFVKVTQLYHDSHGLAATIALIQSIVYILTACLSSYLYFLVFKRRSILAKAFL